MTGPKKTVYIVDDDPSVREALEDLLSSLGFNAVSFGSAREYVAACVTETREDVPACLLLDVELPDINGLELQRQLRSDAHPPIVFISGHGDIPSSVQAMKAGAVDFLPKPFKPEDLLAAIDSGLHQHREMRAARLELSALRVRYEALTPREREVLVLVVSGMLNKQAAAQLGIREVTMQIHRGHVMRKMEAHSLADLVRMAVKLGIATHTSADGTRSQQNPVASL